MYAAMFGFNGISLPIYAEEVLSRFSGLLSFIEIKYKGMFHNRIFDESGYGVLILGVMLLIVWFSPSSLDWLKNERPALGIEDYIPSLLSWQLYSFSKKVNSYIFNFNMSEYAKYFIFYMSIVWFTLITMGVFNYMVDPASIYHDKKSSRRRVR